MTVKVYTNKTLQETAYLGVRFANFFYHYRLVGEVSIDGQVISAQGFPIPQDMLKAEHTFIDNGRHMYVMGSVVGPPIEALEDEVLVCTTDEEEQGILAAFLEMHMMGKRTYRTIEKQSITACGDWRLICPL